MKDYLLMAVAIIATIAMLNAVTEYRIAATEARQIELIHEVTNKITCDKLNEALAGLNDEELTAILGL